MCACHFLMFFFSEKTPFSLDLHEYISYYMLAKKNPTYYNSFFSYLLLDWHCSSFILRKKVYFSPHVAMKEKKLLDLVGSGRK